MIKKSISEGYIYHNGVTEDSQPILFIHGVGGHHYNYNAFNNIYNASQSNFIPYYSDLPGYGYSKVELDVNRNIKFLNNCISYIRKRHTKEPILSISSAGIWLFELNKIEICNEVVILDNPLQRFYFEKNEFTNGLINLRTAYLAKYLDEISIRMMNQDSLGKPCITWCFYEELVMRCYKNNYANFNKIIAFYCTDDKLKPNHLAFKDNCDNTYFCSQHHSVFNASDSKNVIKSINEKLRH